MKIRVNGIFNDAHLFTRKDKNFPSAINIVECTVEHNGVKEASSPLEIECDNSTLKENIVKLIELQGKEVSLECEYVFLHNKYQLIKVL
jgi:hypothetical protein